MDAVLKWVGRAVAALWLPAVSVAIMVVAVRATLAGA
jgi:hypothetical protein